MTLGRDHPLVSGIRYVDHVGLTVPDLDEAVAFFVDVLGAEELYRSVRHPNPDFMPQNFDVPSDSGFELSMLRMPPNLNVELFEWSGADRDVTPARVCDGGGRHLCFVVDDVDAACAAILQVEGVRLLGDVKEVSSDSPLVSGTRWTYLTTSFGLVLEFVDRSRGVGPPAFVGPADWNAS